MLLERKEVAVAIRAPSIWSSLGKSALSTPDPKLAGV